MSASSSSDSSKGDNFKAEALKSLNRFTIFGFGKAQKFEDAADLFTKAGNAYKLANLWESAGESFNQAADSFISAGQISGNTFNSSDAVNAYAEAGNCFKKVCQFLYF